MFGADTATARSTNECVASSSHVIDARGAAAAAPTDAIPAEWMKNESDEIENAQHNTMSFLVVLVCGIPHKGKR